MKLIKILFMLLLLSNLATAQGNVEVHFNYGTDTVYIGARNSMEIWIQNTDTIQGFSLGFEFGTYTGEVNWVMTYGTEPPFNSEGDALGAFTDELVNTSGFDTPYLIDSLLMGGVVFPGPGQVGLPPGSLRKCFTLTFDIPAGEPIGDFCVDNIFVPPGGIWLFNYSTLPEEAPNYFGCTNTSSENPDCPAVCFPVRESTALCGDVNGDEAVNVSDFVFLLNWILNYGPAPYYLIASDVNCSGRINLGDIGYLIDYVFSGGNPPCANCP